MEELVKVRLIRFSSQFLHESTRELRTVALTDALMASNPRMCTICMLC